MLYFLDLAGVAVFAVSGVLVARDRELDLIGVIVVAAITAIGTLRDLLLDCHPIFWVTDAWYLIIIIASALLTVAYVRLGAAVRMNGKVFVIEKGFESVMERGMCRRGR